jgi:hypothetical protein
MHRPSIVLIGALALGLTGCGRAPVPRSVAADTAAQGPTPPLTFEDSLSLVGHSLALEGVWQLIPEFAAGWTDAYQFFADGRFVFHTSEMDCGTRLQSESGRWRVEDSAIVLITEERTTLEGGHFEESMGSCGSDSTLTGAKPQTSILRPPRSSRFRFRSPAIVQAEVHSMDPKGPGMVARPAVGLSIGTTTWYKMRDDPAAYP